MKISGIHHITAIVGHPQENVDFYASVLGLRLVKKTINFDDPDTYHLYFGDKAGNPGSIITFFPWLVKANQVDYNGKIGNGQVGVTSYAVPPGALSFWEKRLTEQNVDVRRAKRFGEDVLLFSDPHGLRLEMVEREKGPVNEWSHDEISESLAIKGFSGASLYSSNIEETASLLVDTFKYERIAREGDIIRFKSPADLGNTIDLVNAKENGKMGIGTVHHIALRANDDEDQLHWKRLVEEKGFKVTSVRDRNYFKAIYFRDHGGILFEIATDPPGFAHDESEESLGQSLMLPSQYEQKRKQLEASLYPIEVK